MLLVFVIGYFAALFPLTQDLLERPAPEVVADRRALISRLRTYRILVGGVLLLTVGTGVVVIPLTRRVVQAISFRGPFPTIHTGLLLIDEMLLALSLRGNGVGVGQARAPHPVAPRKGSKLTLAREWLVGETTGRVAGCVLVHRELESRPH